MEDWRIIKEIEQFYMGLELNKITFPNFWVEEYEKKGKFYKHIKDDAEKFIEKYDRGKEYLIGDKIQDFWHTHCDFCTETITTRDKRECYCTDDYSIWICKKCFDDFSQKFGFKIKSINRNKLKG